jgi:hypothetical protein
MRYKTSGGFLGGPSILVLWLTLFPVMLPYWLLKQLCKRI